MTVGWKEQGRIQGVQEGRRIILQKLLEKRFGALPSAAVGRLTTLSPERLDEIALALFDAKSLAELGLGDGPAPQN